MDESFIHEDLENFPVLVKVSHPFLANDVVHADGSDLAFTLDDGTVLPHEIESFSQAAGQIVAWVKVPLVTADDPTVFHVNYGHAAPPAPTFAASDVWDEHFMMVQHLNETEGPVLDSTVHGNDGVITGATWTPYGLANGAYAFNGIDQKITIPDSESIRLNSTDFTVEIWVSRKAVAADALFELTIYNDGPDTADDIEVADYLAPDFIFVDAWSEQGAFDPLTHVWHVGTLAPGESASLKIAANYARDGLLTNVAEIIHSSLPDPNSTPGNGDPTEDDYALVVVNAATDTIVPPASGMADFAATHVEFIPAEPGPGEVFTAKITVVNQGEIPANAGNMAIYMNENDMVPPGTPGDTNVWVGMMGPGETRIYTITGLVAPTEPGIYKFRAFVDSENITVEKSEGNNQKKHTYFIKAPAGGPAPDPDPTPDPTPDPDPEPDPDPDPAPGPGHPSWMKPDFIVTQIVMDPKPSVAGAEFSAHVTVKNKGDIPGDGGLLRVWVSQPPPGAVNAPGWDAELSVGMLGVGETKTLTFEGLEAAWPAGWHHLLARVNARGADDTDEKSFGNNHRSQVYRTYDIHLVFEQHPDGKELTWNSQWGLNYIVYRATNLVEGFSAIQYGIPATPPFNTWIDTNAPASGVFYYIDVE